MAKKTKSSKTANPVETLRDKGQALVKDINTKLKSTRKELQGQVDDLNKQIKSLQKDINKSVEKDIKKPTMKLIDRLEKNYQTQLKKMQKEFDDRLSSVHALQDKLISQLPKEVVEKLHLKETRKPAVRKPAARKPAAKKAPVAARKAAPKPNVPKTRAPKISDIKGIGPVLQKKLAEAGIKEVSDIASPSAATQKALEEFKQTRGYNTWQSQAKELLK